MFKAELHSSTQSLNTLKQNGYIADWLLIGGMAVSLLSSPRATAVVEKTFTAHTFLKE